MRGVEERLLSSQRKAKEKLSSPAADVETLNLKVMTEFGREFKVYAVSQGMRMVELLKEGFEISKKKRKQ